MKRYILFFINLITAFVAVACASTENNIYIKEKQDLKKTIKIAVITFSDKPDKPGSGSSIADAITSEIIKIPNWTLVERSQIEKIIKEHVLDATGLTDMQVVEFGKILNVDYILVGSVSEYYYDRQFYIVPKTKIAFNGRLIKVKTGEITGTIRYSRETNKHAWCGCCLLGWYYVPVLLLSDQNINTDVSQAAEDIASEIKNQIEEE